MTLRSLNRFNTSIIAHQLGIPAELTPHSLAEGEQL